jgi:NAD(P)-dependent dehydrogenase (short-subunit alcohol dehydrogenase family)
MSEQPRPSRPLDGKVAVVAGATRGAGRGIARMLGEAGAAVYCTGRCVRGRPATPGRPETIEETAEMVTAAGGVGIPVQVDHAVEAQVVALFERVRRERGRLDLLVNDVWGGDTPGYRGNLFYDLAKVSAVRLAYAMACELYDRRVTALAVTPGFLRSEAVLDHFGVTEATWQDAVRKDRHFAESETPCYVGRAVAALAADPSVRAKAGRVWASWTLAKEYGFRDVDGRQPDFSGYLDRAVAAILDRGGPADDDERFLVLARYRHLHLDPSRAEETRRMAAALGLGG